ncbi:MAG: endonuclease/exonuclease/phosphatase family protein [Gemmatimonadales bacterium]
MRFAIPYSLVALGCAMAVAGGHRSPDNVTIPALQGRAHLSPLLGQEVRSSGIVTAVAAENIYLQDPAGDGDPATSDAILVRTRTRGIARGDEVRFTGVVTELVPGGARTANLSVTAIEAPAVEVLRRGRPLPRPVVLGQDGRLPPPRDVISPDELPVNLQVAEEVRRNRFDPENDAIDFFESLEGMLVTVRRPVAVSATRTFSRKQSEFVTLPDAGAGVPGSRRTRAGGILLQSGRHNLGGQNPERVQIHLDAGLLPDPVPLVRVGDSLGDITGVMRYDFGNYEVAATAGFAIRTRDSMSDAASLVGTPTAVTVATYNVLNLSATAPDGAQRRLLARQIVEALRSPDIIALQEIQDDSGEADDGTTSARGTLTALGEAIVAAGGPRYEFFDVAPEDGRPGGAPGGNIRNAFLYHPGRVRLLSYRSLTPSVLAMAGARDSLAFRDSRDPLEGVFEFRGRRLSVIGNHLSSRFGSTPVFGAIQPFVQAGEAERAAQVRALHDYAGHLLEADPGARLIVLGDMNTFEFSDELAELLPGTPAALHPLMPLVPAGERYSYNYEGNSQALDHVFVSRALRPGAELDVVHLNADFPALPERTASDHDPLVARFR